MYGIVVCLHYATYLELGEMGTYTRATWTKAQWPLGPVPSVEPGELSREDSKVNIGIGIRPVITIHDYYYC